MRQKCKSAGNAPLRARRHFAANMIVDFLQFLFWAEFHKAGILIDPDGMSRRPIEEFARACDLFGAVGVTDVDSPFEDIAPVWAMAHIIVQSFQ